MTPTSRESLDQIPDFTLVEQYPANPAGHLKFLEYVHHEIRYAVDAQVITSKNVIAVREGSQHPDQYVVYSGHWDHLGHCTPDAKGDGICNGAVDNATGIAALAELADMNRRAGPAARSQVFLAVTLEESGLLGSEWYAQHPV